VLEIIKSPRNITVRIVAPQPENTPFVPKQVRPGTRPEKIAATQSFKRVINAGVIGIFLGLGVFSLLKLSGMQLNGLEASILVLTPSLFSLFASYIIL